MKGLVSDLKKSRTFLVFLLIFLQMIFSVFIVHGSSFNKINITKFSVSSKTPKVGQMVYFQVKTDNEASNVYIIIDDDEKNEKYQFNKKSKVTWEFKRQFYETGTHYIKLYVNNEHGKTTMQRTEIKVLGYDEDINSEEDDSSYEEVEIKEDVEVQQEEFLGVFDKKESVIDDEYFELINLVDTEYIEKAVENSIFFYLNQNWFYDKGIKKNIDDNNFSVVPFIKNGSTLVPIRVISDALGAFVSYNNDSKTVIINDGKNKIQLTAGENIMFVNNSSVTLEQPAEIYESRIFIPVLAVSEAFDKNVVYLDGFIGILPKEYTLNEYDVKLISKVFKSKYGLND